MEENTVDINTIALDVEQFTLIQTELRQQNENLQTVNSSIGHATTFLILLCIFQLYALLSRARKKGGA